MSETLFTKLSKLDITIKPKQEIVNDIIAYAEAAGYTTQEVNTDKPWGAYIRFVHDDANRFVEEFFPGLSPEEARLGVRGAELSPKILLVTPQQRLSWQYHDRRAERWLFLTDGAYIKSMNNEQGEVSRASRGSVVQFQTGERHRLIGLEKGALVAEIWQHTDPGFPSDEDDIVRLDDDYSRS